MSDATAGEGKPLGGEGKPLGTGRLAQGDRPVERPFFERTDRGVEWDQEKFKRSGGVVIGFRGEATRSPAP
jgi:hypothetical protein